MIDHLQNNELPATVDEAVDVLISDLTTQQMAVFAAMGDEAYEMLCKYLAPYLQYDFRLWTENERLLASCFENMEDESSETDPMRTIMDRMRERLRTHHGVLIGEDIV